VSDEETRMTEDQAAAESQTNLVPHLLMAGVARHREEQYAQALPLYRLARLLSPADPTILHFQGLAEIRVGDLLHGVTLLVRCRHLDPAQPGLDSNIARILPVIWEHTAGTSGTPEWDCRVLAGLAGLRIPDAWTARFRDRIAGRWQNAAFAHYRAERIDEAHRLLEPVVRAMVDRLELLNFYAVIQRRRGYRNEALVILKHCRTMDPGNSMVLFNLANILQEMKAFEAAVACYRNLTSIALRDYNGFRLQKAESISRSVLQIVPKLSNAHIVLGLTLSRLGRYEEASSALADAIRTNPDYPGPYIFLGDALRLDGRTDAAERAYRQAAALNPVSAEALGGIALIHAQRGETEEARPRLERSLRLKGDASSTSAAFTCLRLRQSAPAGTLFPRRPSSGRPALSVSSLNSYGRLAHNIYDYISTRLYAHRYGFDVETPEWTGALFFDLDDPPMEKPRRNILDDHEGFRQRFRAGLLGNDPDPIQDVDVFLGWPLMRLTEVAAHRTMVQGWMKPRAVWNPWLRPAADRLDAAGETIVAVHIRRTDRSMEGGVDFAAYRAWLGQIWDTHRRPVLLVATDDPSVLPEFAPFAPRTLSTLAEPWRGLEHLQDFYLLMNADVMAVSVGGFALTAAALGSRARLVVEPDPDTGGFRPVPMW